ncbi:hypothetical protein GGQ97_001187 [Sphingomonas kaistensis]|uniref:Ice-binding protein C-terminal domain-containing protein n=1 Tax=Sphingomonas kaistensis TaxID=298708 RepID=A0A7X6BFH0_9SPHN|nr:PEPxxWA-CTERM sorting domain-containing protein [Sphingomonas kaistensis]NJC05394.1 hypothetical protein [Sphingomonas kaistensis]
MRKWLIPMAACLFGLASPASAALTQLTISGTVMGSQGTIMCGPGSPVTCLTNYPTGVRTESYATSFMQTLLPIDLQQGDNAFSYGALRSGGLFTGIINNNNGVLTGRDLYYSFESNGVRFGTVGSNFITASATSFSVAAVSPVPEPATWALMLVGFLAVGSALRQAPRRRALLPA